MTENLESKVQQILTPEAKETFTKYVLTTYGQQFIHLLTQKIDTCVTTQGTLEFLAQLERLYVSIIEPALRGTDKNLVKTDKNILLDPFFHTTSFPVTYSRGYTHYGAALADFRQQTGLTISYIIKRLRMSTGTFLNFINNRITRSLPNRSIIYYNRHEQDFKERTLKIFQLPTTEDVAHFIQLPLYSP